MGQGTSKLMNTERTSWARKHNLEVDHSRAAAQVRMLDSFSDKADGLGICYKENTMLGVVMYQHWFITDRNMVIEFGGGELLDNMVTVPYRFPTASSAFLGTFFGTFLGKRTFLGTILGALKSARTFFGTFLST